MSVFVNFTKILNSVGLPFTKNTIFYFLVQNINLSLQLPLSPVKFRISIKIKQTAYTRFFYIRTLKLKKALQCS